jgi:hypothetical protein
VVFVVVALTFLSVLPSDSYAKDAKQVKAMEAVEREFRMQNFERVVGLVTPLLVADSKISVKGRVRLLERLGASYWLTDQTEEARTAFTRLWQLDAKLDLDALVYPPELISFYDGERRRLLALGVIGKVAADSDEKGGPVTKTVLKTVTLNNSPSIAYLMPFGVGQFANGDDGLGTVVAVLQGIGFAGNLATWISVESLKESGKMPPEREGQAELLQGLWIGATAVFALTYLYSVIDGFARRPPAKIVSDETESSFKLRLAPTQQGLGLGLGASF